MGKYELSSGIVELIVCLKSVQILYELFKVCKNIDFCLCSLKDDNNLHKSCIPP